MYYDYLSLLEPFKLYINDLDSLVKEMYIDPRKAIEYFAFRTKFLFYIYKRYEGLLNSITDENIVEYSKYIFMELKDIRRSINIKPCYMYNIGKNIRINNAMNKVLATLITLKIDVNRVLNMAMEPVEVIKKGKVYPMSPEFREDYLRHEKQKESLRNDFKMYSYILTEYAHDNNKKIKTMKRLYKDYNNIITHLYVCGCDEEDFKKAKRYANIVKEIFDFKFD